VEQKFRLRKCGLGRVIYLIEGNNAMRALLPEVLDSAYVELQVIKRGGSEGDRGERVLFKLFFKKFA
jgi:hypothetical protein